MTGQAQSASFSQTAFKNAVCARVYGLFDCANGMYVDVRSYSSFSAATMSKPIDANGNLVRKRDFRGYMTCYTYDSARNLEISRTEGLSGTSCPGSVIGGVTRTTVTAWHPNYALPASVATYAGGSAAGTLLRTEDIAVKATPREKLAKEEEAKKAAYRAQKAAEAGE